MQNKRARTFAAISGLTAVAIFVTMFLLCALITPAFDLINDYVSKLGAIGQPYAALWNIVGFGIVGMLLAVFGLSLGVFLEDKILGACFIVAGIGFSMGGIPTDFSVSESTFSKVHFVAICIAMAGWCFSLARLNQAHLRDSFIASSAKYLAAVTLLPFLCTAVGLTTEPVAHRLMLMVVFSWVSLISIRLIQTVVKAEN